MKSIAHLIAAVVIITTHFTTHSASARIGETLEQCIARYGEPSKGYVQTETKGVFFMAGIMIIIDFVDGQAGRITFTKGAAGALTDAEVATLLRANGGGQGWELREGTTGDTFWATHDNKIAAQRFASDGSLVIATEAAEKALASAGAKKLSGF